MLADFMPRKRIVPGVNVEIFISPGGDSAIEDARSFADELHAVLAARGLDSIDVFGQRTDFTGQFTFARVQR